MTRPTDHISASRAPDVTLQTVPEGDVRSLIMPAVERCGVQLVDVQWTTQYRRRVLQVTIDTDQGVSLEDCEHVSLVVGDVLDAYDISQNKYDLEVTSPGAERTLETPDAWTRAVGRKVRVTFALPGRPSATKTVEGKVVTTSVVGVHLEGREKTRVIPWDIPWTDICFAKIVVDI